MANKDKKQLNKTDLSNELTSLDNVCVEQEKNDIETDAEKQNISNQAEDCATIEEVYHEFAVYKSEDEELTSDEQEHNEAVLNDSERKFKSIKSSKGKIVNVCCFAVSVIILLLTLFYQGNKFGVEDIDGASFYEWRYIYLICIIVGFGLIMLFDSLRTHILLYKSTKIHRPILSYKSTAICRYYDCVTPFSFGGQPFQVFYLNSRGVKGGIASSVPLAKYIFSQVAFCLISLIMLLIGASYYGDSSGVVVLFSILSLAICFLFLFIIIFISIDKKITPKIIMSFCKFLKKIRLIKDHNFTFTKTMRTLFEYQRSIRYYLKSAFTSITVMLLSIGMIVLKGCIPYCIYLLLIKGPIEATFFEIFCKFIICELATMFIPLPGGSGMAEISFTALFTTLFIGDNAGMLFWAILLYRIASYYVYLLQGFIVSVYDLAWGDKLNEKFKSGKLVDLQIKAKEKMSKN